MNICSISEMDFFLRVWLGMVRAYSPKASRSIRLWISASVNMFCSTALDIVISMLVVVDSRYSGTSPA